MEPQRIGPSNWKYRFLLLIFPDRVPQLPEHLFPVPGKGPPDTKGDAVVESVIGERRPLLQKLQKAVLLPQVLQLIRGSKPPGNISACSGSSHTLRRPFSNSTACSGARLASASRRDVYKRQGPHWMVLPSSGMVHLQGLEPWTP